MRKFKLMLVLLAALIGFLPQAAIAQNPTLYLRGVGGNWDANADNMLTEKDGVYTRKFDRLSGTFKIATDDWGSAYAVKDKDDKMVTDMVADVTYTNCDKVTGEGTDMGLKAELTNVTVVFNLNEKTIIFKTKDDPVVTPDPEYPAKLYIIGPSFGGWGTFSETYSATPVNGVYEWTFNDGFPKGDFKISGYDYTPAYTNQKSDMAANITYDCPESDSETNMQLASAISGKVTVRFDLSGDTPTILFSTNVQGDVDPEAPLTVYMSFGQERLFRGDRDLKPRVHFGDGDINTSSDPEMVKVYPEEANSPLWKFDITAAQLAGVSEVVFYFKEIDKYGGDYAQYKISTGNGWDRANWTRYIYYAEKMPDDVTVTSATQSYITFDQYEEARFGTKNYLYITGRGFEGLGWNDDNQWAIMPAEAGGSSSGVLKIESKRGVFYHLVEACTQGGEGAYATAKAEGEDGYESKGAKFKMSWIRPYDYYVLNKCSDIDTQRCWATFNLGIVGMAESHQVFKDGKLDIIRGEGNSLNNEVFASPCRTIPCSNYNQSDWFIRSRYFANQKYYLVVDLEDDCQTVSFVPFKPEPSIEAKNLEITQIDLGGYDKAAQFYANTSERLAAEEVNGRVLMPMVNMATATATLEAPNYADRKGTIEAAFGDNKINYEYDVHYELFADGNKSGEFDGADFTGDTYSAELAIEGISIGDGLNARDINASADVVTLGVRARYTDVVTDLHFHSLMMDGKLNTDVTLPAPSTAGTDHKAFSNGDNNLTDETDPRYTLGAYALVNVNSPATDYAWYGDFELQAIDNEHHTANPGKANGGEVIYDGHVVANDPLKLVKHLDGFNPWSEGDTYGDDHNWAKKLSSTEQWPLNLADVVEVHRTYTNGGNEGAFEETPVPDVKVSCTVSAVYPFIYNPEAKIKTVSSRSAVKARAAALDENVDYSISLHPAKAEPHVFTLTASSDLTGVTDVIAPEAADGQVEYYNLQGVRMRGSLAPGIYIMRQGTKTSKIVIR